jgi:hypothetical protein
MYCQDLKMCLDKSLPPELAVDASARAIEENPDNLPGRPSAPRIGAPAFLDSPLRMALVTGKKWANGRTLRVHFIGGQQTVRQKVMSYASEWMNHANVRLQFVDDPAAEIRVSFTLGDGSWSYLGTDALSIPQGRATMNYGWLTPTSPEDEYSRVVLHEFGHALACIHEHQHPQAGIPWDREAVYSYYWRTNGWSRAEVDNNIFRLIPASQTQFSQFDPTSIMCYSVPNELTIGDYEIGWNRVLSPRDKEFIGVAYPRSAGGGGNLVMNGPAVAAEIGKHQEVDTFQFQAGAAGTYTIETTGRTDVVATLFGPDNATRFVAEDDDTGEGRNARIVERLAPGAYTLKVRHYSPRATGKYEVSVKGP